MPRAFVRSIFHCCRYLISTCAVASSVGCIDRFLSCFLLSLSKVLFRALPSFGNRPVSLWTKGGSSNHHPKCLHGLPPHQGRSEETVGGTSTTQQVDAAFGRKRRPTGNCRVRRSRWRCTRKISTKQVLLQATTKCSNRSSHPSKRPWRTVAWRSWVV